AHSALVASTVNLLGELHTRVSAADVERADSLGAVNLVCGNGECVDLHGVHIDGNFAGSLHGVGMEDNSLFMAELADFSGGLDDADLVVCGHDGDEDGLFIDGAAEIFEIDESFGR